MDIMFVLLSILGGVAIAGTSFFASSLLGPAVKKMGIIDPAGGIPLWGGLSFMSIIAVVAILLLSGVNSQITIVLLGIVAITVFGLLDDVIGLPPIPQLIFQGLLASLVVWSVVGVSVAPLVIALVVILIASINSVNWIDGIDGLASAFGITVFSIVGLYVVFQGSYNLGIFLLYAAAAIAGFLVINKFPARMYMGTAGSMGLGFIIASIPLINISLLPLVITLLALPLADAIWVIAQRLYAGDSIMQGDKRHLHYRLLDSGWKETHIITLYVLATIAFGISSILIGPSYLIAGGSIALGAILVGAVYFTTNKGYITLYNVFFGKEGA